jgi:hypothetical protein
MFKYYLTEAHGNLYNPRETDHTYYDNLKFLDYLRVSDIEEVMESLLWEFMDYGDTLDEAADILESIFSDDDVLCETVDYLVEARSTRTSSRGGYRGGSRINMEARREMQKRQAAESEKLSAMKAENLKKLARRGADTTARARRAERAAAVRGALRGAKQTVRGALERSQKHVTNMRSQLAAKGSSAALKAQAALSKISRTARGAVKGAIEGARKEYQTPSKAPSSRIPGKQRTQMAREAAKREVGRPFDKPKMQVGKTVHGRPAPPPPPRPKSKSSIVPARPSAPSSGKVIKTRVQDTANLSRPSLPPSGKSGGSTKSGKQLTKSQREFKNAALMRRLPEDLDYDLLTQYMIEDIINEGYADSEEEAIYILENMGQEILDELVESYLQE